MNVVNDPRIMTHRARISTWALDAKRPTLYFAREHVEEEGLVSYAPHFPDLYRRAAQYANKILRKTKPADLPVAAADQVRAGDQSQNRQSAWR